MPRSRSRTFTGSCSTAKLASTATPFDAATSFVEGARTHETTASQRPGPVTARVRDIVRSSSLPTLTGADVAQRLFMSQSQLRRLLAAEGTSFRRLRDEHRMALAIEALRIGEPLEVLSSNLGFSDGRAFRRAFRRWTGSTPGAVSIRMASRAWSLHRERGNSDSAVVAGSDVGSHDRFDPIGVSCGDGVDDFEVVQGAAHQLRIGVAAEGA